MEKLIKIIKSIDRYNVLEPSVKDKLIAEQVKIIALEFSTYEGLYYADIHNPTIGGEELFNKFIEEEYGK